MEDSFIFKKNLPKRKHPEGVVCNVCFNYNVREGPALAECAGCGACVHQGCYASRDTSCVGDDWYCERCTSQAQDATCFLCPVTNGAFRSVSSPRGIWAHLCCINWTTFSCWNRGIAEIKVERLEGQIWNVPCCFCNIAYGFCLKCCYPGCETSFHVLCGLTNGVDMSGHVDGRTRACRCALCLEHMKFTIISNTANPKLTSSWIKLHSDTKRQRHLQKIVSHTKLTFIDEEEIKSKSRLDLTQIAKKNKVTRKKKSKPKPKQQQSGSSSSNPQSQPSISEDSLCMICRSGDIDEANDIVFCDRCDLSVHQACYGINSIPQDSWFCAPCRSEVVHPECCICLKRGGALKATDTNQWAHVLCALWIPELQFKDSDQMEPISNISALAGDRWGDICCICQQRGVCISCSHDGCSQRFHVSCAVEAGFTLLPVNDASPVMRTFCGKHSNPPVHSFHLKPSAPPPDSTQQPASSSSSAPQDAPRSPTTKRKKVASSASTTKFRHMHHDETPPNRFWKILESYFTPISLREMELISPYELSVFNKQHDSAFFLPPAAIESIHEVVERLLPPRLPAGEHNTRARARRSSITPEQPVELEKNLNPKEIHDAFFMPVPPTKPAASTEPTDGKQSEQEVDDLFVTLTPGNQYSHSPVSGNNSEAEEEEDDSFYPPLIPLSQGPLMERVQHGTTVFLLMSTGLWSKKPNDTTEAKAVYCEYSTAAADAEDPQLELTHLISVHPNTVQLSQDPVYQQFRLKPSESAASASSVPLRTTNSAAEAAALFQPPEPLDEMDEVAQEILKLQSQLSAQIQVNNQMRNALHTHIGHRECDSFNSERVAIERRLIARYQYVTSWQRLRLSLEKGVGDVPATRGEVDEEEALVCSVCFNHESFEDNPLILCEVCNLSVHLYCYGLKSLPDGEWICRYCQSGLVGTSAFPCALCPVKGGAMKPSVDGRWAHIVCALWAPKAKIGDVARMEPVEGIDAAILYQQSRNHPCSICNIQYGACVRCSFGTCSDCFHPLCAWYGGLYMNVATVELNCQFFVFCEHHTPGNINKPHRLMEQKTLRAKGQFEPKQKKKFNIVRGAKEDLYERNRCSVCFDTSSSHGNLLFNCEKCDLFVHQACYGISPHTPFSGWRCDRCESRETKYLNCVLCPRKGGAFKHTSDGQWIHAACARWHPETRVDDRSGKVSGFNKIPSQRKRMKCYLCKRMHGACINCNDDQCLEAFHPLCNAFSGSYMRVIETDEGKAYIGLCAKHTPLHLAKGIELPDGYLRLSMLRRDLDRARTLVDMLRKREKLKKQILQMQQMIWQQEVQRVEADFNEIPFTIKDIQYSTQKDPLKIVLRKHSPIQAEAKGEAEHTAGDTVKRKLIDEFNESSAAKRMKPDDLSPPPTTRSAHRNQQRLIIDSDNDNDSDNENDNDNEKDHDGANGNNNDGDEQQLPQTPSRVTRSANRLTADLDNYLPHRETRQSEKNLRRRLQELEHDEDEEEEEEDEWVEEDQEDDDDDEKHLSTPLRQRGNNNSSEAAVPKTIDMLEPKRGRRRKYFQVGEEIIVQKGQKLFAGVIADFDREFNSMKYFVDYPDRRRKSEWISSHQIVRAID